MNCGDLQTGVNMQQYTGVDIALWTLAVSRPLTAHQAQ